MLSYSKDDSSILICNGKKCNQIEIVIQKEIKPTVPRSSKSKCMASSTWFSSKVEFSQEALFSKQPSPFKLIFEKVPYIVSYL